MNGLLRYVLELEGIWAMIPKVLSGMPIEATGMHIFAMSISFCQPRSSLRESKNAMAVTLGVRRCQ